MPSPKELLHEAVELHRGGNLDLAAAKYRELIALNPRNADAWHLLGLVELARGNLDDAREHIVKAVAFDGRQPTYHNHLSEVFRQMGDLEPAELTARRAIEIKPDYSVAYNTLGLVLEALGRGGEAIEAFRKAVLLDAGFAQAHGNLGRALQAQGDSAAAVAALRQAVAHHPANVEAQQRLGSLLEESGDVDGAIRAYRAAINIDPRQIDTAMRVGVLLQTTGRWGEAIDCYQRVLQLDDARAEAHCNLGSIYKDRSQLDEAVDCYHRAIELDAALPEAHFNLGVIHQRRQEHEAAIASYQSAILARPDYPHAHNNLGTIYRLIDDLPAAKACYERALAYQPDFVEALNNLGNAYKLQGQLEESLRLYEKSLRASSQNRDLAPQHRPHLQWRVPAGTPGDYALAHYNRALLNLTTGNFAEGWAEYEWRWQCPDFTPRHTDRPLWDGSLLDGRTLLVHAEQGLGDCLQFCRYVKLLAERREGRVLFEAPPALLPLLAASGFENLLEPAANAACDVQIPLMSLPLRFHTTLETIPARVPYLQADAALIEQWRPRVAALAGRKIGIVWQGSGAHGQDRHRSIPLAEFAPLAQAGVMLVSLQKGFGSEQIAQSGGAFRLVDYGEELDRRAAFMDTAAIIRSLDLVITCDTSIAHLAGGLGVRTWVALHQSPDWRWLQKRADSPWYPSMRLFRQSSRGDWASVFATMAEELRVVVSG